MFLYSKFYSDITKTDNASIKETVENVCAEYKKALGTAAMPETKFRLALEELILQFRDCYGKNTEYTITCSAFRKKCRIELSVKGSRLDFSPFGEELDYTYDILSRLNISPHYSYSHGKNRVTWQVESVKTKTKMTWLMLGAVVLAVFSSLIINNTPAVFQEVVTDGILAPLFNKSLAIISQIATPLIFFAVIDGIIGIGDVRSFGKIGGNLLSGMLARYLLATILLAIFAIPAYGLSSAPSTGDTSAVGGTVKLLLDVIPDNLIAPFTIDNDLQVITLAIFLGIVLIMIGDKVPRVMELIKEVTFLVNKMMSICCELLPLIAYLGITTLLCQNNAEQLASIAKTCILFAGISVVFVAIMIAHCAFATKLSPKKFIPKQMPTLMINLATSSQVAAMPENMRCCKEDFGIDSKLADFALPLGMVMYMPCGAAFLGLSVLSLCPIFDVPITAILLFKVIVCSIIVAIAAPPIPGSAFVVLPVLFAACAVPSEALPIALVFGTIAGYTLPAINGFCLQLELLMTAKSMHLIDESKLRS